MTDGKNYVGSGCFENWNGSSYSVMTCMHNFWSIDARGNEY